MITKIKGEFGRILYIAAFPLIFLAATALRLFCVFRVPTEQLYDFSTYQKIAENIAAGLGHTLDGVPVAWQGCGYPYFLGNFYRLIGSTDVLYGKLLNTALSVGTLVVLFFVFSKFFKKKSHVFIALAITAFLPNHVLYVNVLGSEILFTFLLSLLLFVFLYVKDWRISFPLIGVLIGVTSLVKPFMPAYIAVAAIMIWMISKNLKRTGLFVVTATVLSIAVISPWAFRNYKHFGRFVLVSYNSGYVLYINNNDTNVTGAWLDPAAVENEKVQRELQVYLSEKTIKTAHELEPLFKDETIKWITSHPVEFLKLGFLRVNQTFFAGANDISQWTMNGVTAENDTKPANLFYRDFNLLGAFFDIFSITLNILGFVFLFISAKKFILLFFSRKAAPEPDLLLIITIINILFFTALSFVFEGQARYAFPVYMFMIPAAVRLLINKNKESE